MPKIMNVKYRAADYLRLSRDDGDKVESDSISNQRNLIKNYVAQHDDIELVAEMVDDGYSGSNFDRPGFTKLLQAIKERKINCIIVKDLSRFSRDYIGSGMYITNLFPKWGIRLIAINDNYDSINPQTANDELMFSFKSIVNDIYLRDISVKIRSHLDVKRKNGEYMGAFVSYGYMKSKEDRHTILIDENVAENIVNIFNWKIEGMSPGAIANKLNDYGILSPAEYKKNIGSKHNGFKTSSSISKWSGQAVKRILTNAIYTGTLVQGKKTTVSHKVKKIINKNEEDWAVVENSHPAIISKELFDAANDLLKRDTRNSGRNAQCHIFSGMLFCGSCRDSMIRQVSKYKGTEYVYYRCANQKNTGGCSNHNIREDAIYELVLTTINSYIQSVLGLEKSINLIGETELKRNNRDKLDRLIHEKEEEIKKRKRNLFESHQSLIDGIITQEEFADFKTIYDEQISDAEKSIERLNEQKEAMTDDVVELCSWIHKFTQFAKVDKLDHSMLVMLIDRIYVMDNKHIKIVFKYSKEYEYIKKIVATINRTNDLMINAG